MYNLKSIFYRTFCFFDIYSGKPNHKVPQYWGNLYNPYMAIAEMFSLEWSTIITLVDLLKQALILPKLLWILVIPSTVHCIAMAKGK